FETEDFPYLAAKYIEIDYARVYAVRVTYLGELGWELYLPVEQAGDVFDRIMEAGKAFNLRLAGIQSLTNLRLEKGYRDMGHDIDNLDTPVEMGLGFAVKLDKPGKFVGYDVLAKQKEQKVFNKRLIQILVEDPEPLLSHCETVYRNDKRVGYVRAGGYGHHLGGAVGLAIVQDDERITKDYIKSAEWDVEIDGVRYPVKTSLRPMYDPKLEKVKI
ncbi:MAG: aminomethyl transferase family protein, partial [Flavobacteriales bacterium]|nr:aminomethyl transferase family protein [Flavobacteriales bacterium]